MKRGIYLGVACLLAAVAALLTLRAQHTVPVVVASHNLQAGVAVGNDDIRIVRMHEDSVPTGAVVSTDQAIGRYVAWPLTSGVPVVAASLTTSRSGGSGVSGMDIPAGYSAIALPVLPANAVGGMLAPGDRVNIYATVPHADSAGADQTPTTPGRALGHDVLVVQVRTDQGQAMDQSTASGSSSSSSSTTVHGLNFGSGKLGSVVVAVPTADVPTYAAAVNTEVIYLGLSVS